jgi:hypothetical protein
MNTSRSILLHCKMVKLQRTPTTGADRDWETDNHQ